MINSNIKITDEITIYKKKIKFKALSSSGPGGQKINKIFSAVMMKYDLKIHSYPKWLLDNLKIICGRKISNEQILILKVKSHRSQYLNKKEALFKLTEIFKKSSKISKPRKKTKPSKKQKFYRLNQKKRNSQKKISRKSPKIDD
tara:strand:+ start:97 stop:528 length:432 start_codon:yes stop_codon:yes gene_type:complete